MRPLAHQLEHVSDLVLQRRRLVAELAEKERLLTALHQAVVETTNQEPRPDRTQWSIESIVPLVVMLLFSVLCLSLLYQVYKCDAEKTGRKWRRVWNRLVREDAD
jgi:hypothetical protein